AQPIDRVDVRLLHHLQELARVGAQALDVAALPFRVDRVEGKAGLAGAGQPGDADQRIPRQPDGDVFEVVLAGAVDDQLVCSSQSRIATIVAVCLRTSAPSPTPIPPASSEAPTTPRSGARVSRERCSVSPRPWNQSSASRSVAASAARASPRTTSNAATSLAPSKPPRTGTARKLWLIVPCAYSAVTNID